MRWKLIRRRLSISSPRMAVRSRWAWPLRWAVGAVVLGFSAAISLWAFEFGKDIAGLDKGARAELVRLRNELSQLREEREKAQSIANTAESLLKMERAAQERLAVQLKQVEAENLNLKADLGFFERLLPASSSAETLLVRGLQVDGEAPGRWRYQLLVMQNGRQPQPFQGSYELVLSGTRDGQAWSLAMPGGAKPLQVKQYARVDGYIEGPPQAVVKTVQLKVMDSQGGVRATQTLRL
ncbi:DUF6776 family protein [Ideonella sp.]|uniref:DUF6776 family protein n=1 Tax=Ideonella sp. TaxID=1929293 RepID=UPI003BB6CF93